MMFWMGFVHTENSMGPAQNPVERRMLGDLTRLGAPYADMLRAAAHVRP